MGTGEGGSQQHLCNLKNVLRLDRWKDGWIHRYIQRIIDRMSKLKV